MFETLGFENLSPVMASFYFALIIGALFGVAAQITKFCFRRAIAGDPEERRPAAGVWLAALASAILGTQFIVQAGWVSFDEHRFMASELPVIAIVIGGLLFGGGMVLTRGCVSRLTVLLGSGNLRALSVLIIFAIVAHATLKGVFAPIRTSLGSLTVSMGDTVSLANLLGGPIFWAAIIALAAVGFALRSGARKTHLLIAGLLGLLAPLGWLGTGFILYDDFDPIALQSLSFTSPSADLVFWGVASTSIPAGFGVGLILGVIGGALVSSLIRREFEWQSFENPAQTGRYSLGAVMMGIGGVLAGGCTVGAGLSGVPTLSFAAILALGSIALGGVVMNSYLGRATTTGLVPAE